MDRNERIRRKALVESLLAEGYTPRGVSGGRGSALEEANRRDGRQSGFFARWSQNEEAIANKGLEAFVPDWNRYVRPDGPVIQHESNLVTSRAEMLADEINDLLTRSRYPVVNPDVVVVDPYTTRRYDKKSDSYKATEGAPRTWISGTLKVAPVDNHRGRKFIFTGAQNDAPIHGDFWANLLAYADFLGAEVVVGPWTYETQWWSENNPLARSYAPELAEYLCFGQMRIGPSFVFCGEMNTLPTANKPISDLVTYSRGKWAVFPHAKRQLKSVPSTDPKTQAHQVMTTGAVTMPKVIPRKAGVKSIFHHVFGATVVEFDQDGQIFCRQITGNDDGSFYDLDRYVAQGTVTGGHRVEAIVVGDLHIRKANQKNFAAVFGQGTKSELTEPHNMMDVLRPEKVFLHDIFDNEARNHHHAGDSAYSYEMAYRKRESVLDEILEVGQFLGSIKRDDTQVIVVESNHDIGLDRYVREGRYRNDGINVKAGLLLEAKYISLREAQADALDAGEEVPTFSLLEEALRTINPDHVEDVWWVHDGESFVLNGVECGHHGFRGANGAKGTVSGFARMGKKLNIGDKHSPEIDEGVYVAGVMNLRMGYNRGPSSWAVACIVQYQDGKRSIVTMQGGKWRA